MSKKQDIAELSVAIDDQGFVNLLRGNVRCICPFSTPVQAFVPAKLAGGQPQMEIVPRFCNSMCPLMEVQKVHPDQGGVTSEYNALRIMLNCSDAGLKTIPIYKPEPKSSPGGILLN